MQIKKLAEQLHKEFTANLLMYLHELDVWGHILAEGEGGQLSMPSSTQEGGIPTIASNQRWTQQGAETRSYYTIGCGWYIRMVPQFCPGAKGKWQGVAMPRPNQAQQSADQSSAQEAKSEWHFA